MSYNNSLLNQVKNIFPQGIVGIIFDCDGVIIDSKSINVGYFNKILQELGYPNMTKEEADYVQMASVQDAMNFLIAHEDREKLKEVTQRFSYKKEALPHLKIEPGLMNLLHWLKSRGIQLGINTNRVSKGMNDVLLSLDLNGFFDPIITSDLFPAKPAPEGLLRILEVWNTEPSKVAFIGDSLTDEGAAHAASIPLIAYCNTSLSASIHIEKFSDLYDALQGLYQ